MSEPHDRGRRKGERQRLPKRQTARGGQHRSGISAGAHVDADAEVELSGEAGDHVEAERDDAPNSH